MWMGTETYKLAQPAAVAACVEQVATQVEMEAAGSDAAVTLRGTRRLSASELKRILLISMQRWWGSGIV